MADVILTSKLCIKCCTEKPLDLFPINRNVCKSCRAYQKKVSRNNAPIETKIRNSQKMREYQEANKESILENKRKYYASNKEKFSEYSKQRYASKAEEIKAAVKKWKDKNKERKSALNKAWAIRNKEKNALSFRHSKIKRRLNPAVRINDSISSQIRQSLFKNKNKKKWQELVGYTKQDLLIHLESKFLDGMTFDNYGKVWHIDHIRPVVLFEKEGLDVKKCWALTNLQPLFIFDNLSKGAKYNEVIPTSEKKL
jgi:Arc/MetJ-type ribon-helix-helix transcriptional regulator